MKSEEIENIKKNEETKETGVIYLWTNKTNDKKYVGQAMSYIISYGKSKRHGLEGRKKYHVSEAMRHKNREACPKFYPALRKYGVDGFVVELIIIVPLEFLDDAEIYYINYYDSIKNGYNITIGGCSSPKNYDKRMSRAEIISQSMTERWKDPEYIAKTTPANLEAVMKRANEGKTRKKDKELNLPANIYRTENGYKIQIMRDGKLKHTDITSTTLSDEELLKKAIIKRDQILDNMKNNIDDSLKKIVDHNGNELPKGITLGTFRGNSGYRVTIMTRQKNGKVITRERTFSDGKLTMDQKLQLAKEALIEMTVNKTELINKEIEAKLDHNNNILQKNIVIVKKNGKVIGYSVNYMGKRKGFCTKSDTMDKKLELAKQYLIKLQQT